MNQRSKYLKIFGLTENASKDEIRKAYRKLAMQYHPDKNPDPKAQQIFIDLTEACEALIHDKFQLSKKTKSRKEKSFEERMHEAEIRFKQQQIRERREDYLYFLKLTSGKKWLFFKQFAYISAFFSVILLVEPLLPTHLEQHKIVAYSQKYKGLVKNQVICFKTDKDLKIFINDPHPSLYTTHPDILIERSWIFRNPTKIWSTAIYLKKPFKVDFSVISLFPMVPILFLIPLFTIYFKRKSIGFTIAYFFSFYLVGLCVLYFILNQERWFHLLTLSFL